MAGLFELMPGCSWEADGKSAIAIPLAEVTENGKKRLCIRRRPYRRGAKIDDTGAEAFEWELQTIWHNDSTEPGIPAAAYPDEVDKLLETFTIDEPGTLRLPTRGPIRCRFSTYRRTESADARDSARVTLYFLEDNEDDEAQLAFSSISARAVTSSLLEAAQFGLDNAGADSFDTSAFAEFASGLEEMANAPGEFVDNLDAQANSVFDSVQRVEDAFTNAGNRAARELATLLTKPENAQPIRAMRKLADVAKRHSTEIAGVGATIITRTFEVELSIFDVAQRVGQEATRIMAINTSIPDPWRIPPKTPVRVFAPKG